MREKQDLDNCPGWKLELKKEQFRSIVLMLCGVAFLFTPEDRSKYSPSWKHSETILFKCLGRGSWDSLALNSIGCEFYNLKPRWEIFHYWSYAAYEQLGRDWHWFRCLSSNFFVFWTVKIVYRRWMHFWHNLEVEPELLKVQCTPCVHIYQERSIK